MCMQEMIAQASFLAVSLDEASQGTDTFMCVHLYAIHDGKRLPLFMGLEQVRCLLLGPYSLADSVKLLLLLQLYKQPIVQQPC